jgi:hypothetical protein
LQSFAAAFCGHGWHRSKICRHSSTPKECSKHREEVHPGREENWNRDLNYLKIKVNPGVMMHC